MNTVRYIFPGVQLNLQHSSQAALDKGNGLFVRTL